MSTFNIAYIDPKSVPIRLEQKLLGRRWRLSSYFIRRVIVIRARNFYEVAQPHENFWISRRLTRRLEYPEEKTPSELDGGQGVVPEYGL